MSKYYKKMEGNTTMKNTNMIDFDNEMKNLSAGVYEGNEN